MRSSEQQRRSDFVGRSMTALCGGALAVNVLLVAALLVILAVNGLAYFWQRDVVELRLDDGSRYLGEIHQREPIPGEVLDAEAGPMDLTEPMRIQVKVGNRDVTGVDFLWIDERRVAEADHPPDAVLLERLEWGNFYGWMRQIDTPEGPIVGQHEEIWSAFHDIHERKVRQKERIDEFQDAEIGPINHEIEELRLERRRIELEDLPEEEERRRLRDVEERLAGLQADYEELAAELFEMRREWETERLVMETIDGARRELPVAHVVRALRPNRMGTLGKVALYGGRVVEFLWDNPRESNTEGGIFPAIFGTVMMVFIMTFAVTPFGVLAALYLREYARQGPLVRIVRIAVNNLAGVPSIVFGVFGLGFFVYLIGGTIDQIFYPERLPTPTYGTGGILWAALTLALLTVPVVIVATEEGLAAVPRVVREGSLALGATKFETIWRVVLPASLPGILTGMILAMARAAGEVAPLMIVGMVKLAPSLPVDGYFPYIHLERKFMHLGFHIYDVGFQSPNVDATKPLVFATALLLILVVTLMNLVAILIRNHLSRKLTSSAF